MEDEEYVGMALILNPGIPILTGRSFPSVNNADHNFGFFLEVFAGGGGCLEILVVMPFLSCAYADLWICVSVSLLLPFLWVFPPVSGGE